MKALVRDASLNPYLKTIVAALKKLSIILIFSLPALPAWSHQPLITDNPAGFRAAVVKSNITPANSQSLVGYGFRMSTGVNDSIFHRIIIMDDGNTRFIMVSSDVCYISPAHYDNMALRLKDKFGIDPANFWWSVTHTHSAPELGPPGLIAAFLGERYTRTLYHEYTEFADQKLVDGIAAAIARLVPARLGAGWGFSQANINRRALDIDGKARLGLNPDGPVDRRIGLLRLEKQDGTPLALIANYPVHATVLGAGNLKISGDAPGIVSEYVEKMTGAPLLFINGASGNLAPIYSVYPDPVSGHLGEFRVLLGDRILEANRMISSTTDNVTLSITSLTIETPKRSGFDWPSDLGKYMRTTNSREEMVRLPIQFLKINNDIVIWSAPIELFCEVSNEIRSSSPFPFTFYFGLTNGWLGYLVHEPQYKHEGYEIRISPYTPAASGLLINSVSSFLRGELMGL
jgi:neutral ceramidase